MRSRPRRVTQVKGATNMLVVVFALTLCWFGGAAYAADLSSGYQVNNDLPVGTIVANDPSNPKVVVPANLDNNDILGVVVENSTVAVSYGSSQVQVSSGGMANVLVSDINGPVHKGDKITSSPLDGIGMKATEASEVIGTVQADLTGQSSGARTMSVKNSKGVSQQVAVALLPLSVSTGFYQPPATQSRLLPKFITDLATTISGRDVPTGRLLASFVIMAAGLVLVAILVFGGVHSSIGAIGRNPLAKRAIQGSLAAVIGLAAVVLVVSSAISYLVLKG